MKHVGSIIAWSALALVVVVAMAIAALWFALPIVDTTISIDGEHFSLANGDQAGRIDWTVSVDSTINRAHQHATTLSRVEAPAGRRTGG